MGLPVVVSQHEVQIFPEAKDFLGLDLHVGGLSLESAHGLMEHDARARKGVALSLNAGGEQHGGHAGGLPMQSVETLGLMYCMVS